VSYLDTTSERMSDEQANLLLHSYTGGDAREHIADFNDAYAAGFMARELPPSKRMDRRMAQQIAEQGRKDAEAAEQKRQATIGAIATGRRGTVTFTENMADAGSEKALKTVYTRLSDAQKYAVSAIRKIAHTTGVNFVFFESQADDTGRYTAENGHYDVKTGTIYLDMNSGKNSTTDLAEYAILRTAGHELTHFMEHSSKEGYAALRDFVTTELTRRGEDFDALVVKKMDNAARSGAPLTRAGAISEVVADASELMLRDTKAIERLAQKDQGLMGQIKGFLRNFMSKLRRAFEGVDAVHEEARVMMQELAEEFQQKWDFALEEAVEQAREGAKVQEEAQENVQMATRDQDYFDNIDQHPDIHVVQVTKQDVPRHANGGIDKTSILDAVRNNPLVDRINGRYVTFCNDIDGYVELNTDGITHGYNAAASPTQKTTPSPAQLRNARAAMLLPELLKNSVEVNRSAKYAQPGRPYGHVLMAVYAETDNSGVTEYYAVRMVVAHSNTARTNSLLEFGVVGQLHAVNAKKVQHPNVRDNQNKMVAARTLDVEPKYSVSDLIRDVNGFDDTFSEGAYKKIGTEREKSDFSEYLMYSVREQTETPEFQEWFGNSQVVDAEGNPKVMYHGTAREFWTFDKRKANDLTGRRMGLGSGKGKFYLTEHEGSANAAAYSAQSTGRGNNPKVMELYVSAQKVMDAAEYRQRVQEAYKRHPNSDPQSVAYDYQSRDKAIAEVDRAIRKEGYDGVWDRESGEMFVFEPEQIKSATDNVGTFDPENPDIRYSLRDMPADLTREYIANMTASDALNDVEKDAIRIYSREVGLFKAAQAKLDQVIAERDAQPEDKQKMYAQRVRDLRQMVHALQPSFHASGRTWQGNGAILSNEWGRVCDLEPYGLGWA